MKTFVCMLTIAALAMTAMAADVSGKWSGTFTPEGQDASAAFMVLKVSGTTLTGSAGPDENQQWPISGGKVEGNKLSGQVTSPDGATYKFTLTVEGEHIKDLRSASAGRGPRHFLQVASFQIHRPGKCNFPGTRFVPLTWRLSRRTSATPFGCCAAILDLQRLPSLL